MQRRVNIQLKPHQARNERLQRVARERQAETVVAFQPVIIVQGKAHSEPGEQRD